MQLTLSPRATRAAIGAVAGILAGASIILTPHGAAAAPGNVQVSPDGVSYSASYPGALFDTIARIVPGDSDQQSFYLRNSGTEPGHLRVTLSDVVAADADFASALTVSASTAGYAGIPASLLEANPCWVLLEGRVVAPGEVVRVVTTLALGQLHGQAGQGASAELALNVALTSTAAQLPPTSCGSNNTTIPVVPRAPASSSEAGQNPGATSTSSPPAAGGGPGASEGELPVLPLPGALGIDPNTWRLFEELLVLLLIGGFLAGTAWFAIVARRRRKTEAEMQPEEGTAG